MHVTTSITYMNIEKNYEDADTDALRMLNCFNRGLNDSGHGKKSSIQHVYSCWPRTRIIRLNVGIKFICDKLFNRSMP